MDPIRKIPKKITKKFVNKVINRQYFHRKTGLEYPGIIKVPWAKKQRSDNGRSLLLTFYTPEGSNICHPYVPLA